MHIGFTGTRHGMTIRQRWAVQEILRVMKTTYTWVEFHHGDCTGSDEQAHQLALFAEVKCIHIHPPTLDKYRAHMYARGTAKGVKMVCYHPQPYMVRNQSIVDSTELLMVCPRQNREHNRSGTWATVRRARQGKSSILILKP